MLSYRRCLPACPRPPLLAHTLRPAPTALATTLAFWSTVLTLPSLSYKLKGSFLPASSSVVPNSCTSCQEGSNQMPSTGHFLHLPCTFINLYVFLMAFGYILSNFRSICSVFPIPPYLVAGFFGAKKGLLFSIHQKF